MNAHDPQALTQTLAAVDRTRPGAAPRISVSSVSDPAAPSTVALGIAVARRRREIGCSQHELAARSALHRAYIGGIEQGRRNPTWRVLAIIAAGLGLRLSELVERAEAVEAERAAADGGTP